MSFLKVVFKKKEYSDNQRQTVVKYFLNGDSEHEIARKMIIPPTSIDYVIAKYKKQNVFRILSVEIVNERWLCSLDRVMERKVNVDQRKSASSVKAEIEVELRINISEQAVGCRLLKIGFKGRVARKRSYMDKANRIKHVEYVRNYREKPSNFWDYVLWTDESRFNLFGSDQEWVM